MTDRRTTTPTLGSAPPLPGQSDTDASEGREESFVITAAGCALLEHLAATAEGAPPYHPEARAALLARLGDLDSPESDAEPGAR